MANLGVEKERTLGERVQISLMQEHDLLEVVEIEETTGLSRWGWDAYYGELNNIRDTIMLIARPKAIGQAGLNRIVGFIAARLSADELHINNMAVRDEWRQLGIGALLLGKALEEGLRRGARRAFLEVRASNEAAQALYRRFGFRITGRRPRYYAEPLEDALVMTAYLA